MLLYAETYLIIFMKQVKNSKVILEIKHANTTQFKDILIWYMNVMKILEVLIFHDEIIMFPEE